MSDEITETTEQNPEVEETPEEKTQVEETQENPTVEKETPKEKTKETYTDREKRYYARMKESDEIAKKAKSDLAKAKEDVAKAKLPISDIDAILEVQQATKGLDGEQVAELKLRASAMGIGLLEARNDSNYQLWQKGYNEKVEKAKALNPSTTQSESQKPKTLEDKLASAKTFEEKGKILKEAGMNPLNTGSNLDLLGEDVYS